MAINDQPIFLLEGLKFPRGRGTLDSPGGLLKTQYPGRTNILVEPRLGEIRVSGWE